MVQLIFILFTGKTTFRPTLILRENAASFFIHFNEASPAMQQGANTKQCRVVWQKTLSMAGLQHFAR